MKPRTWRWIGAGTAYIAVSVICALAADLPAIRYVIGYAWGWVWLLGPPALLVHQAGYATLYLLGTLLIVGGVIAVASLIKGYPEWALVIGIGTLVFWFIAGALVYVPNW